MTCNKGSTWPGPWTATLAIMHLCGWCANWYDRRGGPESLALAFEIQDPYFLPDPGSRTHLCPVDSNTEFKELLPLFTDEPWSLVPALRLLQVAYTEAAPFYRRSGVRHLISGRQTVWCRR